MVDITNILYGALLIIISGICVILVPWIKGQINAEELAKVMKWVKIGVQAAEMLYVESGLGQAKKRYVMEFLNSKGCTYDENTIDNLIESAVLELKKGLNANG